MDEQAQQIENTKVFWQNTMCFAKCILILKTQNCFAKHFRFLALNKSE
jgi:hypothetical protein